MEVEQAASRNPYRPRTTPIMKHADYAPVKRVSSANPNAFTDSLRGGPPGSIRTKVDDIWLANRNREANERRLKRHTQKLVGQWERQLARFEEEMAWKQEMIMATMPHMNRIKSSTNRNRNNRGSKRGSNRGSLQGGSHPRRYWMQDAWTENIVEGEPDEVSDNEEDRPESEHNYRIDSSHRNASRPSLPQGMISKQTSWKLPPDTLPGAPGVAPGMSSLPGPAEPVLGPDGQPLPGVFKRTPVYASPIVPPHATKGIVENMREGGSPRGGPRKPMAFSPFRPASMYSNDTFQRRPRSRWSGEGKAEDTQLMIGRMQCDRIKNKLARHGIHLRRGNLERALLVPKVVLSDKKREECLPNHLGALPLRPGGSAKPKKAKKAKGKKGKKGKGKKKIKKK